MADEQQGKIPQDLIDRINELARKKKATGLTAEEQAEQKRLREDYLARLKCSRCTIRTEKKLRRKRLSRFSGTVASGMIKRSGCCPASYYYVELLGES